MGTKKKASNGSTSGATIPVNANGHSKKKTVDKTKNAIHLKELLDSAQIEQLIGLVDNRELLKVLTEVKNGNFTVRMPIDQVGLSGKICDTLNEIISINEKMMQEFTRAGNTIGKQGKLTQRIELPTAKGSWATGIDSFNVLISDLVHPTIEIAHVISSVAKGNLSQEMSLEIGDHALQGEFARIA